MESRVFYSYLDARDSILAEERLENIWVYNYSKLKDKARSKVQKRWEKIARGWFPKRKMDLAEAVKIIGKNLND